MRLYTYFRSSAAFRVRIALNLKGLAYEPAFVHLAKGEHRAPAYGTVNPQALLPTLEDHGHLLNQSLAIIEYLEETHPRPPLLPRNPFERARVRSIALLVACEIHPINNLRVLQHLKGALGRSQEQVDAWYRHWVADGLARVEAELQRKPEGSVGTGAYCHGDSPTLADCCLVPQVFNAQRYQCDTTAFPAVMRVFAGCMGLDAFERAHPARQPDAE
ncbi:MAG TPA: maleylacetoacetate isomerase [Burkholderiales bacterium]|nr:maleylacetoacetate isomerase [Burkholderiales bacterium]